MKVSYFLYLLLFILVSCNRDSKKLNEALEKAGQNRKELEIVLSHYEQSGEKEKYKAAVFLISNMQNKYGRYGDFVKNYFPVFEKLKRIHEIKLERDSFNKVIKSAWDSVEKKVGPITPENMPYFLDVNVISSEYLIENIDYAFRAWKEKPWAKQLNFDQFCEFILPYRVFDEPLQFYRKQMFEKFSWLKDSVKDKSNPIEACLVLNKYLANRFVFNSKLDQCPMVGINDMLNLSGGICEHRYYLITMIMRAVGIPVGIDYTPIRNDETGGHYYMVLLDKNGKTRAFNGGEPDVSFPDSVLCPIGKGYTTKAYRSTFYQDDAIAENIPPKDIPPFFRNANIVDVTEEYQFPQKTIKFKLNQDSDDKMVYLCCFGMSYNIVPVAAAKKSFGSVKFPHAGLNCVYFPAYYSNNNYTIAADPVYFASNGEEQPLIVDFSKTHSIKLGRKYYAQQYLYSMYDFAKYMKGATFQAADNPGFENAENIFTIDSTYFHYVEKNVSTSKPYRYYRYLSSATGPVRVAEIDFMVNENMYGEDKSKRYKIFGYAPKDSGVTNFDFKKAFDANLASNFNAPAGSWVAIDFGKESKISKIRFLVRNDLNVIEIGDTYQLLYFDKEWKLFGQKVADKNFLQFDNVPENALLLLRDLTKGREERIFIYKNGKQVFL